MARNASGIFLPTDVWAATGDKSAPPFPITDGWDSSYSTPGNPGPQRTVFNNEFNKLSALAVDVNQYGCNLPWSNAVDYLANAYVVGSDNKIYVAVAASGPDNGGAVDPTTDVSHAHWNITIASQSPNAVAIEGGNINNTDIGSGGAAGGVFTQAYDDGSAPVDSNQLTNKDYVDSQVASATEIKAMLTGNTNGTSPTITYSKNIATFTHLSTGVYGVTFTTPIVSAEYVPILTFGYNSITGLLNYRFTVIDSSKTINGFEFEIQDATDALVDNALPVYFVIFYG